jgi:glycine/D-amino acid oxidase-like deaminating enzyme
MRRAQALGARLRVHTQVQAIEALGADEYRVETTSGPVRAHTVIVAAGAETRRLVQMVGLDLPILPHPLQVMVTEPWPPILTQLIQHAGDRHLSLRQTQYGTFVIGGGWPALDATSDARLAVARRSLAGNAAVATDVLPALRDVRLIRAWAGMTTSTGRKNRIGFLGRHPRLRTVYALVAGGWGFTLSPVLGRLMAELVIDGETSLPVAPFDLEHALEDA